MSRHTLSLIVSTLLFGAIVTALVFQYSSALNAGTVFMSLFFGFPIAIIAWGLIYAIISKIIGRSEVVDQTSKSVKVIKYGKKTLIWGAISLVALNVIFFIYFSLFGVNSGYTTVYHSDPQNGKTTKINFSPSYISDAVSVDEGLDIKLTGYNKKRVNPITHSAKKAIGALEPDDMDFTMSFVVHFRNSSSKPYDIGLASINLNGKDSQLTPSLVTLLPGATFSTKEVFGSYSQWDRSTTEEVTVSLNFTTGNNQHHDFPVTLKRETMEELNSRLDR